MVVSFRSAMVQWFCFRPSKFIVNGLRNFISWSSKCHGLVNFISKQSLSQTLMYFLNYTATNLIICPVCIMIILNIHFLVSITSSKNMTQRRLNVESMWFAFGDKWATEIIILPHANRIVRGNHFGSSAIFYFFIFFIPWRSFSNWPHLIQGFSASQLASWDFLQSQIESLSQDSHLYCEFSNMVPILSSTQKNSHQCLLFSNAIESTPCLFL